MFGENQLKLIKKLTNGMDSWLTLISKLTATAQQLGEVQKQLQECENVSTVKDFSSSLARREELFAALGKIR